MLRGAIIGFGEVAKNGHWPAYETSDALKIVAVVDRSPDRRALASSLSPAIATFSTVDELASWTSSDSIDFIDICTPPALHFEPMVTAFARGWHVLCEKPLLLDPVLFETVRRQARETEVAVVPVHNWKYAPIVRRATASLRAGAIGRLRRVEIDVSRLRAAPTAETGRANWRRDAAMAGGGILMDHGWHAVYLVLDWFGQRAVGVHATIHRAAADAVEDEASVTIEFPGGEAVITLTWNGGSRRNTMRLAGDAGEIVVADDMLLIDGVRPEQTRFAQPLSGGSHHDDWFAAMLPDISEWFRAPQQSAPIFEEAAECLSIIRQAYVDAASSLGTVGDEEVIGARRHV